MRIYLIFCVHLCVRKCQYSYYSEREILSGRSGSFFVASDVIETLNVSFSDLSHKTHQNSKISRSDEFHFSDSLDNLHEVRFNLREVRFSWTLENLEKIPVFEVSHVQSHFV